MGSLKTTFSIILVLGVILGQILWGGARKPVDYIQFWAIGQAVTTLNISNVYAPPERIRLGRWFFERSRRADASWAEKRAADYRKNRFDPAGTPFLYSTFKLISTGDFRTDYLIYHTLSLLLFAFFFFFIGIKLGFTIPALAVLFVLARFFWPLRIEESSANVNQIQLGILSLYLWLAQKSESPVRNAVGGLVLGGMFLFKPTVVVSLGLLGVAWVMGRELRRIVWTGVGFATAAVVGLYTPDLVLDGACQWSDWAPTFQSILNQRDFKSFSFLGLLLNSPPPDFASKAMGLFLVAIPCWILLQVRDKFAALDDRWRRDFLLVWMGFGLHILASPMVHGHYFTLLLPLALYAWARSRYLSTGIALLFMVIHPFLKSHGWVKPYDFNLFSYCGSIILLIGALRDLAAHSKKLPLRQVSPVELPAIPTY